MSYFITSVARDRIRMHLRADAVLRPLVDKLDFPEERIHLSEVYPALLRSIVGQQVSTAAAKAIYRRFLLHFDLDDGDVLASPAPQVLAKADLDELRNTGLSRGKALYVTALAQYFVDHSDTETRFQSLDDETIIAELTKIKGIGRWTAEMMLIFALGRQDLLPLDDLAIYQSMISLYDLDPTAKPRQLKPQMIAIADRWRPYRSIACLYLYAWRNDTKLHREMPL